MTHHTHNMHLNLSSVCGTYFHIYPAQSDYWKNSVVYISTRKKQLRQQISASSHTVLLNQSAELIHYLVYPHGNLKVYHVTYIF